jgi:hypothetical protein
MLEKTDEIHNLYSLPCIRMIKSREMRWTEYVACTSEMRSAYRILDKKPEGKKPMGRPKSR